MTCGRNNMLTYTEMASLFETDQFRKIDSDSNATKFYYLRSISKAEQIKKFATEHDMNNGETAKTLVSKIYDSSTITVNMIKSFIKRQYSNELKSRSISNEDLVKELNTLEFFDWGGSQANSLERNIINNYVKKMPSYHSIDVAIDNELLKSLRGYTMNSWYNHWSSILIEDLFKRNKNIIPTVGRIKKIDFFVNDVPFDLKVTYFPEELMKQKLKDYGFGIELTKVKQMARKLGIEIPELPDKKLNIQLQSLIAEQGLEEGKEFISNLKNLKKKIITDSKNDPVELITWLYENQGERRFDASNRFYLILTDEHDIFQSWKLKRNITKLKDGIDKILQSVVSKGYKEIEFNWKETNTKYTAYSEILFITA